MMDAKIIGFSVQFNLGRLRSIAGRSAQIRVRLQSMLVRGGRIDSINVCRKTRYCRSRPFRLQVVTVILRASFFARYQDRSHERLTGRINQQSQLRLHGRR
ncbi:hypothetical protein ALQ81_102232 [Pseudomonas syringae pv. pisi]|nr:hypothetical protein ALQ81_102232 [Pseudomonas syringae pv. pisi]